MVDVARDRDRYVVIEHRFDYGDLLTRYTQIIQGHGREVRIDPRVVGPPLERVEDVLDRAVQVLVDLTESSCSRGTDGDVCEQRHASVFLD